MGTPTRINWPRWWGKPHKNTGAIPRVAGTLPIALGLYDVVYNECKGENARLIVFHTGARDEQGAVVTLALQAKYGRGGAYPPRWPGTHTILMPHSHIQTIDAWTQWYWRDRLDPDGWRELPH